MTHALRATLLVAFIWLTGCALNRPYPDKVHYLTQIDLDRIESSNEAPLPFRIKVRHARVVAAYEGKSFVYRLPDDQWETDFYHEWFAYPRDMLTEACIEVLEHTGRFTSVSSEDSLVDAQYYLEGTIQASYWDKRDADHPACVLKTQWTAVPSHALNLQSKERKTRNFNYEQTIAFTDNDPQAYSKAMAVALERTMGSLAVDLEAWLKDQTP